MVQIYQDYIDKSKMIEITMQHEIILLFKHFDSRDHP